MTYLQNDNKNIHVLSSYRGVLYMRACVLSHFSLVQLFETLWTVTHQAPLSLGFSRQEYWSGSPIPSAGDLPGPGVNPGSSALQVDSLPAELPNKIKLS